MNFTFLDTGSNPGKFNMDYDLELVERCKADDTSFLRFYKWNPYCISLGYNQTRNKEPVNYSKCREDGIDVVTRPTGGRAVLHSEELTYSVVLKTGKPVREIYSEISLALLNGLKLIDKFNSTLQKISAFTNNMNTARSSICFASSVKNEINYLGRKLVGSAQRKFGDVILQHGSILIGDYHKNIVKYISSLPERGDRGGFQSAISLNEILNREVSYQEVGEALLKGFELTL